MQTLDELGINLATKHKHTQWVSLRELIQAIKKELKEKKEDEDTTDQRHVDFNC
jgi:hypothetical protein